MKKAIGMVLALCVIFMLLTGCSPGSANTSNESDVTLVFSFWGRGDEKKALEKVLKQFETENPGIRVKTNYIPADYMTKMSAMAAGNSLPDIGYFEETATLKWAENGKLMDLSELFNDESLMPRKLEILRYVSKDGKTVGASVGNEIAMLFYNKDIFDEAGLPYPPSKAEDAWTWQEFVDVAKKLTKDRSGNDATSPNFNSGNIATYGALVPFTSYYWNAFMWSNGGGILDTDNKTILLDKPESIEVLQAMQDLIYVHKVCPVPANQVLMPTMSSALLTRQVAMQVGLQYELMTLAEAKKNEGLNYGVAVLPKFKEPVTINGGSPIVIFQSTEHPEEAKKLFAYLMNPENMLSLIRGGLWMPNEEQYYTDPQYTEKWINEEVHTPDYKTAVVDYTYKYCRSNPYYRANDISELDAVIIPDLNDLIEGRQDAQTTVDKIMPGLRTYLEERDKN